ncbi:hypothetical protein [Georgenia sp. SUBG003]|uniref:hypothetical protein n=1 Tax=Georgenia sp. SUBG003 TaxID=1497974 RepID=UPI003AB63416
MTGEPTTIPRRVARLAGQPHRLPVLPARRADGGAHLGGDQGPQVDARVGARVGDRHGGRLRRRAHQQGADGAGAGGVQVTDPRVGHRLDLLAGGRRRRVEGLLGVLLAERRVLEHLPHPLVVEAVADLQGEDAADDRQRQQSADDGGGDDADGERGAPAAQQVQELVTQAHPQPHA